MPIEPGSPLATVAPDSNPRAVPIATPISDELRGHQIAQMVHHLFYRARDARRPLVQQWKKNYRVLHNKTWTSRAEPWMPAPEISNIWPLISSLVAWMTDQRPGMEVTPNTPPFSEYADHYDKIAEHMNALLDANFAEYQVDAEIERMLWDVATYGIGYLKTVWEPWLADGLGDSVPRRVNPLFLYPDPHATDDTKANYFVEAKIMSLEDLDRAFPGAKNRVRNSVGIGEDMDEAPHRLDNTTFSKQPRVNLAALSPATTARFGESPRAQSITTFEDPVVTVLEAWIRHHEVITHKDDSSIAEGTARVVDRWKCVVVVGNVVLMEEWADEIYGHASHPYSRMPLFDTGEWYGPSLVEFLTSPQESINRMLASIEHNLLLLGNPIYMRSARTNRGGRPTITNRPGQIVEGNSQTDGWMMPPPLHPDMMNLIMYYESKLESISGLSAIMRGFSPTGRNSEDVMSSVQDSAFVRVRATLRNLERVLRSATMKCAANIAEFYTEPRIVSIVGPDDEREALPLKARHFYTLPDADGKQETPMRFTLRADAGSEHPTSRQARQAQGERLYALGALDDIEILKASKWPNYRVVAERNMKLKASGVMPPPGKRQAARAR